MQRHRAEESYPLIEEDDEATFKKLDDAATRSHLSDVGESSCPLYFGVRSYLHNFYARSPSAENAPALCEDCVGTEDSVRRHSNNLTTIAKIFLWISINLLLIGSILIVIGYCIPHRPVKVGYTGRLEIVDRSAANFNIILNNCIFIGCLLLICGVFLCILSTVSLCGLRQCRKAMEGAEVDRIAQISGIHGMTRGGRNVISPIEMEGKIPVTEQITAIQPTLWQKPNV